MTRPGLYPSVPKHHESNLAYRLTLIEWVTKAPSDEAKAERIKTIKTACRRDPLWWCNCFLWTYDPLRFPSEPHRPFITFDYQDELILTFWNEMNGEGKAPGEDQINRVVVKQRDAGATYCWEVAALHQWQFLTGRTFLLASYKQEIVDTPDDMSALFPKLDYMISEQPHWLRPKIRRSVERTDMRLVNPENGNVFKGAATTADIGRGGRRTGVLVDEFAHYEPRDAVAVRASLVTAANSVVFLSTPNGRHNAFGEMAHNPKVRRTDLRWEDDPRKKPGMYTSVGTKETGWKLKILDEGYDFPRDYPFVLDGMVRSPWLDFKEQELGSKSLFSQEILRSFHGSGKPVVTPEEIEEFVRRFAMPPMLVGELDYDPVSGEPVGFREQPNGRLRLWMRLGAGGRPDPSRVYVMGSDISSGTGASNSVDVFGDALTGEVLGEFTTPHLNATEFASYSVALARWLKGRGRYGAYMIWEGNGPTGKTFCDQVDNLGYGNVYKADQDKTMPGRRGSESATPGWFNQGKNVLPLFEEAIRAMKRGQMIIRSEEAIREFGDYAWQGDGTIDHARSRIEEDPSGARANHGDRCVGSFLMWHGVRQLVDTRVRTDDDSRRRVDHGDRRASREASLRARKQEGWLVGARV